MFYVYLYFDPRTDQPFYVGKGQGDRGFFHLKHCKNKELAGRLRKLSAAG
jgi:uncharacterized protein